MISIITTLRTGVQFLPECAVSISAQTHQDWEWLIGVNGFAAQSPVYRFARSFADNERVRVFDLHYCTTRPQASHALVHAAHGDLIAVHDVDDRWHPTKLEKQAAFMALNPYVGLCATRGRYFGEINDAIPITAGLLTYEGELKQNHILHSSVLMRREHCRWPDTDLLDDYPTWLALLRDGVFIYILDEELTEIRIHRDQYYAGAKDNSAAIRKIYAECPLP